MTSLPQHLFVFAPNGAVIACAINAHVSLHVSCIAEWSGVYDALEKAYKQSGGHVIVDSAFAQSQYPFLLKSAQDNQMAEGVEDVVRMRQQIFVRQAPEWGIAASRGASPG